MTGNLYSNCLAENTLTFNIQLCIWRLQAGWVSNVLAVHVVGPVFQYQSPGTEARNGPGAHWQLTHPAHWASSVKGKTRQAEPGKPHPSSPSDLHWRTYVHAQLDAYKHGHTCIGIFVSESGAGKAQCGDTHVNSQQEGKQKAAGMPWVQGGQAGLQCVKLCLNMTNF